MVPSFIAKAQANGIALDVLNVDNASLFFLFEKCIINRCPNTKRNWSHSMEKKSIKATKETIRHEIPHPRIRAPRKSKSIHAVRHGSSLALIKPRENPIISPIGENWWEAWQTFNPGAILLDDVVHFLYRAIGSDGISRLGYAASRDGFSINERLQRPAYEHGVQDRAFNVFSYFSGGSWGGAEDPRIVRVDDEDTLYMTYTACNGDLRVGLASIKISDFLKKRWKWRSPRLISPPGEVHKNWLIFPEKIGGKYAILHSINPTISIAYVDSLDFQGDEYISSAHGGEPRKKCWDRWIRGVGPIPLKTKYGWLVLYHAMDADWSKYKVGAMLLDLNDPTRIIARAKAPILEPNERYENFGFKGGVVYASGAVIKDDTLLVYYGCADSYVCIAYANCDEFLDALIHEKESPLKKAVVRKKR